LTQHHVPVPPTSAGLRVISRAIRRVIDAIVLTVRLALAAAGSRRRFA
jgi:hypothetical protein